MNRRRPAMILIAVVVVVALVATAIVAWPRPADDGADPASPPLSATAVRR